MRMAINYGCMCMAMDVCLWMYGYGCMGMDVWVWMYGYAYGCMGMGMDVWVGLSTCSFRLRASNESGVCG